MTGGTINFKTLLSTVEHFCGQFEVFWQRRHVFFEIVFFGGCCGRFAVRCFVCGACQRVATGGDGVCEIRFDTVVQFGVDIQRSKRNRSVDRSSGRSEIVVHQLHAIEFVRKIRG